MFECEWNAVVFILACYHKQQSNMFGNCKQLAFMIYQQGLWLTLVLTFP